MRMRPVFSALLAIMFLSGNTTYAASPTPSSSSGGYTRSTPSPSSTPSRNTPPPTATRPSPSPPPTTNSYTRAPPPTLQPRTAAPLTGSDQKMGAENSRNALEEMRRQNDARKQENQISRPTPSPPSPYTTPAYGLPPVNTFAQPSTTQPTPPSYPIPSMTATPATPQPPPVVVRRYEHHYSNSGVDVLNMMMFWQLMENARDSNNYRELQELRERDRSNYDRWHNEAQKAATNDPELAKQLKELEENPVQTSTPPKPVLQPPATTASPPQAPVSNVENVSNKTESSIGLWMILAILAAAAAGATAIVLNRRKNNVNPLRTAAAVVNNQLGRTPPKEAFQSVRVGAPIALDISPFVLAEAAGTPYHIKQPENDLIVQNKNVAQSETVKILYADLGDDYYALVQENDGNIDAVRVFQTLDRIQPQSAEEWRFWLADDGAIGAPDFQTKNNVVFARHWNPGNTQISPKKISFVNGATWNAMLYSRMIENAPAEYILVAAVEHDNEAYVMVAAGLDMPTTTFL